MQWILVHSVIRGVVIVLVLSFGFIPVEAADIVPSPPPPPGLSPDGPPNPPPPPTTPPVPEATRPSIDPGIVVTPPTEPHPKSSVQPPDIDPDMAIHPQDSPTTQTPKHDPARPSPGPPP